MKQFFKKIFWMAGLYLAARFGYRLYRMIKSSIDISKTLPLYIKNLVGEKPSMDVTMHWKRLRLTLGLSSDVLAKHEDLESTVREYILDFYPLFEQDHITIDIQEKEGAEPQDEDE